MSQSHNLLSHASLDIPSRQRKAEKIARLIQLDRLDGPVRILEIGCGSGVIAHYFATNPAVSCDVFAVDVVDQRVVKEGFDFQQVTGVRLPFEDQMFDLVISNHVIEHVGDRAVQQLHLAEIQRLLKQDGCAYLATPNRWMIIEPHYGVAFLSWLPPAIRSSYLRLLGKGRHYDCHPRSASELESLFAATKLISHSLVIHALRETLALERGQSTMLKLVSRMPPSWLNKLVSYSPTLIYRLQVSSGR